MAPELSLSICIFLRCIFKPEIRNFGLGNQHMVLFTGGVTALAPCFWLAFSANQSARSELYKTKRY